MTYYSTDKYNLENNLNIIHHYLFHIIVFIICMRLADKLYPIYGQVRKNDNFLIFVHF